MHRDVDGIDEDEMDDHRAWRCTIAHIDLDRDGRRLNSLILVGFGDYFRLINKGNFWAHAPYLGEAFDGGTKVTQFVEAKLGSEGLGTGQEDAEAGRALPCCLLSTAGVDSRSIDQHRHCPPAGDLSSSLPHLARARRTTSAVSLPADHPFVVDALGDAALNSLPPCPYSSTGRSRSRRLPPLLTTTETGQLTAAALVSNRASTGRPITAAGHRVTTAARLPTAAPPCSASSVTEIEHRQFTLFCPCFQPRRSTVGSLVALLQPAVATVAATAQLWYRCP
ncbi:hypothetical protein C4D60_Mb06t20820 [Musa balbisiana]|uniref:Uncharacterized protein n=1 Tax=Musa balbisiana TaxID=52838 RepID=A0A4S8IPL9_MUSBA|nr:hypothetical protein C4D60_Mb06t20820 [Musa balbisiana]